jgi:hypothetical protein
LRRGASIVGHDRDVWHTVRLRASYRLDQAGHFETEADMATDLRYKMIMALSAADLGSPICEQAAEICAEIADQHCAQLHVTGTAPVIAVSQDAVSWADGLRTARAGHPSGS